MTNYVDVLNAIQAQVNATCAAIQFQNQPVNPVVGKGWPNEQMLNNVSNGAIPLLIGVIDVASYPVANFRRRIVKQIQKPTNITAMLAQPFINSGSSTTLTLAFGTKQYLDGETVSLQVVNSAGGLGATASASSASTLAALAATLAQSINDGPLKTTLSAAANGDVVTLTNLMGYTIRVATACGNDCIRITQVKQVLLEIQVSVFANSQDLCDAVGGPLDEFFGALEEQYGPRDEDGNHIRLIYRGSTPDYSNTTQNLFCQHMRMTTQYGINRIDKAFVVLGFNQTLTPSY